MKEPPGHSDVDKFANNDEVVGLDELSARLGQYLGLAWAKNSGKQLVNQTCRFQGLCPRLKHHCGVSYFWNLEWGDGPAVFPFTPLAPFQPSSPSPSNLDFVEICLHGPSRQTGG